MPRSSGAAAPSRRSEWPFQLRMRPELRSALEQARARQGRSLNAEIIARLEQSFAEQDQIGGAAMQDLVRLWIAGFLRGGRLGARVVGHPEWTPDEWLRDPFAFRTAVHAGMDAVLSAEPQELQLEEDDPVKRADLERLWDYYTHKAARSGAVTVIKEEKS
jgi:Arc-like DNA binding domain